MHFTSVLSLAAISAGLANANPLKVPDLPSVVEGGQAVATLVPLSAARIAELESAAASNSSSAGLVARQSQCTFTAYSGDRCDFNRGGTIVIDANGVCIRTDTRHSFYLTSGCRDVANFFNDKLDCQDPYAYQLYQTGCYNVNTGRIWQSSNVLLFNTQ